MRKINVFLGGSSEALKQANHLKVALEKTEEIQCTIWNKTFVFNQSFLVALSQSSYTYDFGVFMASKDDIAVVRKNVKVLPRDNVIFEYGLFTGVVGNNRTFLVQEEGTDLPSDLSGYTTPRYKAKFGEDDWTDLAKKLASNMKEQIFKSEIQALPSTSLAIGYFESFLKPVVETIYLKGKNGLALNVNSSDVAIRNVKVVLPNFLSNNINEKATKFYDENGYKPDSIGELKRPFPIRYFYDSQELVVVDMPTTLNAIRSSVNLLIPDTALGENNTKLMIERRELENFKKTLEYLISQNDYACDFVEVIFQEQ